MFVSTGLSQRSTSSTAGGTACTAGAASGTAGTAGSTAGTAGRVNFLVRWVHAVSKSKPLSMGGGDHVFGPI